jgi:histidinol-phosphate phosphatase family protein
MINRAVFIDRDGTMAKDIHYCSRPEDFELFPNTAKAIKTLNDHGFNVIVITNQSGIARGYFTEAILTKIHVEMKEELAKLGAFVDAIYYCPHHPDDNCECRKPKTKLVFQAVREHKIDLKHSFVVGDLQADIDLGHSIGCKTILVGGQRLANNSETKPDAIVHDLLEAAQLILTWDMTPSNS